MLLTKMRIEGKKPTQDQMNGIIKHLQDAFNEKGYITEVTQNNGTSIKISQGGRCFSVDTAQLGYNAQVPTYNRYGFQVGRTAIAGYVRTNLPTWDQRVHFNNIINGALDVENVSCNIKSGPFTIREGLESMTECDWEDQIPSYASYDYVVNRIVTLDDDMIQDGKERLKEHRKEQKRLKLLAATNDLCHAA